MILTKTMYKFIILHLLFKISFEKQFAAHTKRKCISELVVAWSRELSTSPFPETPLITYVDVDGQLDIVAASFSGDVHVVRANSGQYKQGTSWPYRLVHSSIHARPLQFDIDSDGCLDLLIVTSNGELIFIDSNGDLIKNKTYHLGRVRVARDWFLHQLVPSKQLVDEHVLDDTSLDKQGVAYVQVDPHVLATPVIDDVNQDGVTEELVIPVSYYYDDDDYSVEDSQAENQTESQWLNYLTSALVIFNLTSMRPIRNIHLDLTKRSVVNPGYLLASPTVTDVDLDRHGLEIVIGTASGHLYVLDIEGRDLAPFPLKLDAIQTQVLVEDVNVDGAMELIVQDMSASVLCIKGQGQILWKTHLSGLTPLGTVVADVNGDGQLEIIIATDDGLLWMLAGSTGEILNGWPMKVGHSLNSPPLVTRLYGLDKTLLVTLGLDGSLHLLSTDRTCRLSIALGASSLVSVVSHDVLSRVEGVELLVASRDGTLICLMQNNVTDTQTDVTEFVATWASSVTQHHPFNANKLGVVIERRIAGVPEYTSTTFPLTLTITDDILSVAPYTCQVSVGGVCVVRATFHRAGDHTLDIPSPSRPLEGHLVIECRTKLGHTLRDVHVVKFHTTFLLDLQWLLVGPTLAMAVLILFLHGFPAVDILPVTVHGKTR